MLEEYKRLMKESWQAKFAGIMLPVYAIVMPLSIIFIRNNFIWFAVVGSVSLFFLASQLLLIRQRDKKFKKELEIFRNSFISNYDKEPEEFGVNPDKLLKKIRKK